MTIEEHNGTQRIEEILAKSSDDIKSTQVSKEIPIENDLGNIAAVDFNSLDEDKIRNGKESKDYLRSIGRDATQDLLNNIFKLDRDTVDNLQYAILPPPSSSLPREKPIPKPKAPTKWETYMKDKGIKKRKKDSKVWDDVAQDFIPRYGKLKVQIDKEKNWVMEVPRQSDIYEDQFAKAAVAKKERIAKNEYQRLRNIARTSKTAPPGVGVVSIDENNPRQLKKAMHFSRYATASIGKFQPTLKNEKDIKGFKKNARKATERPFVGAVREERKRSLNIIERITNPQVNAESNVIKEIEKKMTMSEIAERRAINKTGRRSKLGGRGIKKSGSALASLSEGKLGDKYSRKRYTKNQEAKEGAAGGKTKKGGKGGGKKGKSAFGGAMGRKTSGSKAGPRKKK